jgi:subtilisin family serine protease
MLGWIFLFFLSTLESLMSSKLLMQTTRLCSAIGLAVATLCATSAVHAADTTRVIVSFKPSTEAVSTARSVIASLGGQVKVDLVRQNAVAIELPTSALAALKQHASVALVEEDAKRYPLSVSTPSAAPYKKGQSVPYGIKMVQADQMPDGDKYAGNMTICIIDSGYDNTHEDLARNKVTGDSDPSGAGDWFTDGTHHGTHVAGTIAAINNKGVGVVGVLPSKRVNLHIVKVFGDDGTWAYSSSLVAATNKCEAAGAKVISMSLGGASPTSAERSNFLRLSQAGILSIAAAGNGGSTATSYPAGYASVMSVAAIDENKTLASFSQRNADVEIAAPGVSVLSTVPMGAGEEASLKVGTATYAVNPLTGAPLGSATGALADFGLGTAVDTAVSGKVCLISRGTNSFGDKVKNCQDSGGLGAVIYNNVSGNFNGTLGTTVTTIPSVSASDTDGTALKAQLGQAATVALETSNYAVYDGTSMATPHVSAVAALVWSYFPTCTGEQIRKTLNNSALDLGASGRDNLYGYGLVQAKAAYDRALSLGCGN